MNQLDDGRRGDVQSKKLELRWISLRAFLQRYYSRHGFQSAWSRLNRYPGKIATPAIEPGSVAS